MTLRRAAGSSHGADRDNRAQTKKQVMENSLFIALSRQMTVKRQLETVANNLANANTSGFKAERLMFVEYLQKNPDPKQSMYFVQDLASARDNSPGDMKNTGNPLDFAVQGPGWFVVQTPNGAYRYTRDGHFRLNAQGLLITRDGFPVMGEGDTPIAFQQNDQNITVTGDGTVKANDQIRGKIKLVEFANLYRMQKVAGNLYSAGTAPQAATKSSVLQGMIEGSNVKPVLEIAEMMRVLHSYQGAAQFIQQEDDRERNAIDRLTQDT